MATTTTAASMALSAKADTSGNHHESGFTLVELMVVIAIVSILAVIAMGSYSDYAIRSQVTEGIGLAAGHKSGVVAGFYTSGILPTSNALAGVDPAADFETDYVSSIGIGTIPAAGTISISYKIAPLGGDNILQLVPTSNNGLLEWNCIAPASNGIRDNYLPASCRG
jgi:type IV pilus assembly protein PilA